VLAVAIALSSGPFFDGYCSTVQGLLDWFEVDLWFTDLSFIQINLCVLCVLALSSGPFELCKDVAREKRVVFP